MAMLIVDDEEFELEVARSERVTGIVINSHKHGGRGDNDNVSPALREVIAEDALSGIPAKEISKAYGVSASSISAYKNGATSTATYHKPQERLASAVDKTRDKIHRRASSKLLRALTEITDDKLKDSKATDLSTIAANMSRVIEKTSPKESNAIQNNIIFVSPTQIHRDNYEVIDA